MKLQSIYERCGLHSEDVRALLRMIPTDVALCLTEEQLVALLKSMHAGVDQTVRAAHASYAGRKKKDDL